MNKKSITRKGFTLVEVLITLKIIGIIAAITIPSLINNTNNSTFVIGCKKAYETLNQVYYNIKADNGGDIANALTNLSSDTDADGLANVFISKLNVAKYCGAGTSSGGEFNTGCFANIHYKYLNGNDGTNPSTASGISSILTNDGLSYGFLTLSKNCTTDKSYPTGTISSPLYNTCGSIRIDINGPNKGPSVYGRDYFSFYITKKGIIPYGAYPDNNSNNDCSIYGGGCISKIILEGAMNY